MASDRCAEHTTLVQSVAKAGAKVRAAKHDLDAARESNVDLIPCMALLVAAKLTERYAVASLDEHDARHGCIHTAESRTAILSDYEAIRASAQQALIDFLLGQLKAGTTFVQSALVVKNEGRTDHFLQAKQNSIQASEAIQDFVGLVKDTDARTELQNQLAELERLISGLGSRSTHL